MSRQKSLIISLGLLLSIASAVLLFTKLDGLLAASTNWSFDNGANYTFNGAEIQVSGGEAELQTTSLSSHVDDADVGEFGAGTLTNTQWDVANTWLEMTSVSSVAQFVSRVFDGTNPSKPWIGLAWVASHAYGKALPNNGVSETGYGKTNADMSGNVLLLHGDETSGTTLSDSSGSNNNATCTNCPTLGSTGVFGNALSFDGVNDVVSIADSNSLDLTTTGTVDAWVNIPKKDFSFQRPITLSTATTEDEVTIMLDINNTTVNYANMQSDGDDIRFTDSNENVLPYWIEYWKEGANENSRLWITIKNTGTTAFTMHYGNANAEQGSSGFDTFLAFNDIEGQQYHSDKWDLLSSNSSYGSGLNYFQNGAFVLNGFLNQRVLKSKDYIQARTKIAVDAKYTISEVENSGSTNPALCNILYGERWTGTTWVSANHDFFCWNSSTASTYDKSYGIDIGISPAGTSNHVRIYENDPLVPNDDVRVSMTVQSGQIDVEVTGDKTYSNSWTGTDTYVASRYYVGAGFNYDVTQNIYWVLARAVDPAEPIPTLGAEVNTTAQVTDGGDWMYERTLTINGTIPENNYQIRLTGLSLGNKVQTTLTDLRFYQASDGQELPYWVGGRGTLGGIWIKVANKDETQLIMKYGNPHITTMKWAGEDVFDFYDDFSGETLDDTKWLYEERRGDNPTMETITNFPLNNGRLWRNLGRFQSGAANGWYQNITTVESFTGYKAIHVRYSKTANGEGYLCFRYGVDGDYSSLGSLNVAYMNVYKGVEGDQYYSWSCPAAFNGSISPDATTNAGVSISQPPFQSTYSIGNEEFQVAPDGIRRHFYVYGYAEGIGQTQTIEYDQTSTAVRTPGNAGKFRMLSQGGWYQNNTQIYDEVVIRKQSALGQEPTITVNDDEKIIGAGKHGAYGIGISGTKAYVMFGNRHLGSWLKPGWNHIAGVLTGGVLSHYLNGTKVSEHTSVTAPTANTQSFELGGFTGGLVASLQDFATVTFDELNIHSTALSAAQILNHYLRGALDLKFQIRSCDDVACSGETFVGPDGTSTTYFTDSRNTVASTPTIAGVNVGDNQYAQYKVDFESDGTYSPELHEVRLLPDNYVSGTSTIAPNSGQSYTTLATFTETLGAPHTGQLEYQITNNGTNWYFWDGTQWTEQSGAGYNTETNTASEINAHLLAFVQNVGTGTFNFRAFLNGNGYQPVSLSNVALTYSNTDTAPSTPTTPYANTATTGAQSGSTNPGSLSSDEVVVSAIYADADTGDAALSYELEVATDNTFTTIVYSSGKTAFTTPVIAGNRTPNIAIPSANITEGGTYYWRLRFYDVSDNTGTYMANGGSASTFTIADISSPAISTSTPSANAVNVDPTPTITLVFDDTSGVDQATVQVQVGGTFAVASGVCQAGYACTFTTNGTELTVQITPDSAFTRGASVTVNYEADDNNGNTLSSSLAFTIQNQETSVTLEPTGSENRTPTDGGALVRTGSGGGSSGASKATNSSSSPLRGGDQATSDQGQMSSGSVGSSGAGLASQGSSGFIGSETQLLVNELVAISPVVPKLLPKAQTKMLSELAAELLAQGELHGSSEVGDSSNSSSSGSGGNDGVGSSSSLAAPSSFGSAYTHKAGTPLAFTDTVCADLDAHIRFVTPKDLKEDLEDRIRYLEDLGMSFVDDIGEPLRPYEPVTRSELLKYLIQVTCADYEKTVDGVPEFPDVKESHQNHYFVQIGRKYGYISGYKHSGLYQPDQQVTFAEALKIISEFFMVTTEPLDGKAEIYSNVDYSEWYGPYIRFATDKGVLRYYDTIEPSELLTLEQVITLVDQAFVLRSE